LAGEELGDLGRRFGDGALDDLADARLAFRAVPRIGLVLDRVNDLPGSAAVTL